MMKKLISYLSLIILFVIGCSKNDAPEKENTSSTDSGDYVFYNQYNLVYTTNLTGENKKIIVKEGDVVYIQHVSVIDKTKRLVYSYSDDDKNTILIKTVNFDGTNPKIIKTISRNEAKYIIFLKGISNGSILYQISTEINQIESIRTFCIKPDGTETELSGLYAPDLSEACISSDGNKYVTPAGKFVQIINDKINNDESFELLLNENKKEIYRNILLLSPDSKKLAYMIYRTTKKLELRIKNVSHNAPASDVLTILDLPTNVDIQTLSVCFFNGTKNILASYTTYSSPYGSPSDYTHCQLIDTSNGNVTDGWELIGRGHKQILTN